MAQLTKKQVNELMAKAIMLWAEDDSLAPDRETLVEAVRRFWPNWGNANIYPPYHTEQQQELSLQFVLRETYAGSYFIILQGSYPGNGAIYVADAEHVLANQIEVKYGVRHRDDEAGHYSHGPFNTMEEAKAYEGKGHVIEETPSHEVLLRWKASSKSWVKLK